MLGGIEVDTERENDSGKGTRAGIGPAPGLMGSAAGEEAEVGVGKPPF